MASKTIIGVGIGAAACAGALLVPACAFAAGDHHGTTGWAKLSSAAAPIASGTQGMPVTTGGASPQPVTPGGTGTPQPVSPGGTGTPQPVSPGGTGTSPQPVTQVSTTTVVTVGARATAGQTLTIRAQVRVGRSHPHGIKAESGTVTFAIDGNGGGSPVTIKRGRASEQVTLAAGKHTVVATYSGDADHKPSTSAPVTFTLN